jgi:NADH-quinone oxidoreductase subunit A
MNVVVVLGAVLVLGLTAYAVGLLARIARPATDGMPFLSGHSPAEHAVSRFHVRWYTLTMIFLAFDMEMVFMYPWTLVVTAVGLPAVVEMFLFLALLVAGVWYAKREGVLRWT